MLAEALLVGLSSCLVKAMPLDTVKQIILASTIVWFLAAPFWMKVE